MLQHVFEINKANNSTDGTHDRAGTQILFLQLLFLLQTDNFQEHTLKKLSRVFVKRLFDRLEFSFL